MSKGNGGGGFFAGFLIGAVVGGAAAVLLTQEDARDRLAGKAREAAGKRVKRAAWRWMRPTIFEAGSAT